MDEQKRERDTLTNDTLQKLEGAKIKMAELNETYSHKMREFMLPERPSDPAPETSTLGQDRPRPEFFNEVNGWLAGIYREMDTMAELLQRTEV